MTVRKQESFMRGALMLTLAALVSRLLGAFYKPLVARIFAPFDGEMGAAGIGLTQVPLTTYQVILSFTSVGLNVGISKLVAERMALGDPRGAKQVFRMSLVLMGALGLAATAFMWFGAATIAGWIGQEALETIPGFRAMAPALFVVSIMAAYRGLFQGFQQMTPNAYSQIIEQVVRVGSGLILTYVLVRYSVPLGAAGFNFGDVIGAGAGLAYLMTLVRRSDGDFWRTSTEAATAEHHPESQRETPWELVKRIFSVAAPIAISGAVVPLMMQADTFFVFRSLPGAGLSGSSVQAQYGMLTNAFMVAYLPTVFTTAIYTSILPALTESMTLGQVERARHRAIQAYRMTTLAAIPSQVGLYVLAGALYTLLFGDPSGASVMAAMSWAVAVIMLQQTTSGVLQGIGRIGLPVVNFALGALIKIVLTAWWTPIWGINGAAYATAVGFLVAALLNVIFVERLLGRTLQTRSMVLKPLAGSLAMAGVIALLRWPLSLVITSNAVSTLLLVVVGAGAYGITLLMIGGVKRQEIELLPGIGPPMAKLLMRTRLLR